MTLCFTRRCGPKPLTAGWTLAIPAGAENKDLAWLLLQFQSDRANAVKTFEAGRDPILLSTFVDPAARAAVPDYPFEEVLDGLRRANPDFRPHIPEYPKIQDVLGLKLSEAYSGQKPVEQALQEADEEIREIMADAGYYD